MMKVATTVSYGTRYRLTGTGRYLDNLGTQAWVHNKTESDFISYFILTTIITKLNRLNYYIISISLIYIIANLIKFYSENVN